MQFRSIFAISALAGLALGANNSTLTTATPSVSRECSFRDFTATASSQVASVAACPTAVGNVLIQGDDVSSIDLTGLEQLYGDLRVVNASSATALNAPTLQLVSGTLLLSQNHILATLNLAQLTTVNTFQLTSLPHVSETGLSSGITSAETVIISDTSIRNLNGINVYRLRVFNVNNNGEIESIDSGLQSVTESLTVSYNAENVDLSFDQLSSARNIDLQSINSFSASNLTRVTGSISIMSSDNIQSIELRALNTVGNSLTISENEALEEIDFPRLRSIGGALEITDNDDLRSFDGFPRLETVGGSITLNGSFDNGTFENLERVAGGFTLSSDGDLTCREFSRLNRDGAIRGDRYQCSGASGSTSSSSSKSGNRDGSSTDTSSGGSGSDSSSSGSSSSRDSGASSNAVVQLATVFAAFLAVGVAMY